MGTEVLLKIVEGGSAIVLLAIGILYLLTQRRNRNNVDHSRYVTQVEFEATVVESRRLNENRHK